MSRADIDRAEDAVRSLLARRGEEKSICPSEAARLVAGPDGDWREQMEDMHRAVDHLLADGEVVLRWKGTRLETRAGPYRIERARNQPRPGDPAR